ncbi:hypothetical protein OK344_11190 [Kaistella sp. BT6-1-3]|uniref:DUF3108 domain-containing protein n=1 Tax=Kaistella yananensis TaxID=2989820 RepID=A0ABT3JPR1_9FLAO|nr:hypothetical protein [Kaistella yananensis]MCW4452770.1 hypothetical protein [Kaistella yananensis]
MKIIKFILISLIPISCTSQNISENYVLDDVGILVEKSDSAKEYDVIYNSNNKIYTTGKAFVFSYYYKNLKGEKFLITKGEEIKKENYSIFGWKFIEFQNQNEETIKEIKLKPLLGNPFSGQIDDYNQTGISYEYIMKNSRSLTMEITGVIENEPNIWIHPPRNGFFQILELNPFPYIKAPYKIGTKWNWKLDIGDNWSDKRWFEWKGRIENNYDYEIVDKKTILTKLGNLECFIIHSKAKSRIGETELISFFNPEFGFVKLEYKNIDGTKTILELEKVE